jgi:membrane protein
VLLSVPDRCQRARRAFDRHGFARRLGLNHQAAADVSHLFSSSSSTANAVTGAGYLVFILSGIAAATALQQLYERAFEVDSRGMKDVPRRVVWLGLLIAAGLLAAWAFPHLRSSAGPVLLAIIGLAALTLFWWLTMWLLLAGRISWRDLFPAAVATAVFWVGMEVVFSFTFSGMVTSNQHKYGSIGVVFSLMSWLIAIGVVVILGAAVGVVWHERRLSSPAPIRRTRRDDAARER